MAISRCNKCAYLQEQSDGQIGESIACLQCGSPTIVYPTLFFVGKLLEKCFAAQRELIGLKKANGAATQQQVAEAEKTRPVEAIDLANTDQLSSTEQHRPIAEWFGRKQIPVEVNSHAVDDGLLRRSGDDHRPEPSGSEGYDRSSPLGAAEGILSTVIPLDQKFVEEARTIITFCQQLYEYSFVGKYLPNREKNSVRLVLQTAPAIRQFFAGEWLEWFVMMTCLGYCQERGKRFSCARQLIIMLSDHDRCELDVFMLIDGQLPICIECKSGEYRQDIDKYLGLRKRLGLSGNRFVLCIAGLSDEHARGLSAMYDLTFVSERGLLSHLGTLF
ncbi:MAG: hypothetical protein IPK02_13835 [Candidatus Accumulibacter sp.]|uniref:DUF1887 family protein n=1 Tax=Candidatus Accumulibacter affinis TaxID=2954384 RepID=A0A935W4A8_9PROT|nr:hypothetical protein [Candidatus Accumulibacter affinis]